MEDNVDLVYSTECMLSMESSKHHSKQQRKPNDDEKKALKHYASSNSTLAQAIIKARKDKSSIDKSTEAETVTNSEKLCLVILGIFSTIVGALIVWWILVKYHENEFIQLEKIVSTEFPDALKQLNATKDKQIKSDMNKLCVGFKSRAHKLASKLDSIDKYSEKLAVLKATQNWKKMESFSE